MAKTIARRNLGGTGQGNRNTRVEALRALQGDDLLIYAVRREDGSIKIGASAQINIRLNHVPHVEVLALRRGSRADERAIHHSLRPHVVQGREYYHATPEVLAVVNDMRQDFNLPPLEA